MIDPVSEPESDSDFEYEGRGAKRGRDRKCKSAVKTKPTRSGRRLEDELLWTPASDRECRDVIVVTKLPEQKICFRITARL